MSSEEDLLKYFTPVVGLIPPACCGWRWNLTSLLFKSKNCRSYWMSDKNKQIVRELRCQWCGKPMGTLLGVTCIDCMKNKKRKKSLFNLIPGSRGHLC